MNHTLRPRSLFVSACAGIFVFGTVLAILGTVFGLPAMRARLHVNLAQEGTLFLLLYLGIFAASLAVGPLIDHLGYKMNLLVSSLIVASAMVSFAGAHSFGAATAAAILLGLGGGGLNTSKNALVSDLYGEQRGPMLNLLASSLASARFPFRCWRLPSRDTSRFPSYSCCVQFWRSVVHCGTR